MTGPGKRAKMRTIHIGSTHSPDDKEHPHFHYKSNNISTTKYSLLTFLPKSLIFQFLRFANIYFLVTAIIQSIPYVSPLNPFSAIAPLIFVLGVSMSREAIEDFGRYRQDRIINLKMAEVRVDGEWKTKHWKDIKVGNLVRVTNEQHLPCDLVVLSTSYVLENRGGCYIETASLDGEKNLKPRMAIAEIMDQILQDENKLDELTGEIVCSVPDASFHNYDGVIEVAGKKYSLSPKQLLLRGASLRNTAFVVGVAVYTGHETKVMKNAENGRYKISKMENKMNDLILKLLILQALLYLGAAIGFSAWILAEQDRQKMIPRITYPVFVEAVFMMFTYFILLNTILPISLIVTLEIVKIVQSYFLSVDHHFYNAERDMGCKVMTRSINEELGQVEYVFSDKTGTLTRNIMELKYFTIGNSTYEGILEIKGPDTSKYSDVGEFYDERIDKALQNNSQLAKSYEIVSDDGLDSYRISTERELVDEYLTLASTCHDCVIEITDDAEIINYEGPSPDEICLVTAAKQQGYVFLGTTSNSTLVDIKDQKTEFELISLFEFDNKRKMMSVLIKHNNKYKLFAKGADSAILNRLSPKEQPFLELVQRKLKDYSKEGLRTLCMGCKILSEEEVIKMREETLRIDSSENKKDLLPKFLESIENNFFLLGGSAVEDKLQDKVPETIHNLLQANIKVWMLTGDKRETAENIGLSCNLINSNFELIRLTQHSVEESRNFLPKMQDSINLARQRKREVCTVVEGECLHNILLERELALQYLNLMKDCESVICCRVTPMQKAQVVRLVKKNLGRTTLAIGDGANDVNMIQEGDIGVGIIGLEGRQAANASDFAVPEFKAIWRLLFVHGRWSYFRNSEMILYFFYKNMLFTIPQFFFVFLNAYSGQSLFDDLYMTFYNMIFTAFPLGAKAVVDQDIHYEYFKKEGGKLQVYCDTKMRECMPYFYKVGQEDTIFNNKNFLFWIFKGIIHGFIIWFLCSFSLQKTVINSNGHMPDFWFVSVVMFTSIVLVVTLMKSLIIRFWTWLNVWFLVLLSLSLYFGWIWISDFLPLAISRTQITVWTSGYTYLVIFLNIGWFTLWQVGLMTFKAFTNPNYEVIGKTLQKSNSIEKYSVKQLQEMFSKKKTSMNQVKHA